MRFSLAALTRRAKNPRRALIPIRPITAPATQATNLYQSCFAPIITAWLSGLPEIEAEYARTLAEMTTDAPSDVQARISQVESEANAVLLRVSVALERWAATVERWHRARWAANVKAATSVDLEMLIGPADARMTLEAAIARNTALIRSISDESRRRIGDTVFRGLQNRTPVRDVARQMREAVGMERKRALRVASDQSSKLSSALNEERRRQAGIDSWEWVSSGKVHPREEHKARNGLLYSENPERQGEEYQGKLVRKPPDRSDWPGVPINCGCTERSVLILD